MFWGCTVLIKAWNGDNEMYRTQTRALNYASINTLKTFSLSFQKYSVRPPGSRRFQSPQPEKAWHRGMRTGPRGGRPRRTRIRRWPGQRSRLTEEVADRSSRPTRSHCRPARRRRTQVERGPSTGPGGRTKQIYSRNKDHVYILIYDQAYCVTHIIITR